MEESWELDEVIICGLCDEHLDDEDDLIWHFINKHRFELSIEISNEEIEDYIKEFGGEIPMGGGTEQ